MKMTAKCPMDPSTQKLSSKRTCGHFDTILTCRTQTGQTLGQFEIYHFWNPLETENLRFGSTQKKDATQ